jgi:threonyl-tRNA synthetase
MGHEETYSTIQIDFHLPERFDLSYIAADGQAHRPVMIHRAIVSTMERMISYLIELYGGAFPVWLAPVQAIVLPISDRQNDYARQIEQKLIAAGIRAEVDGRSDKINFKIREAQLQKIPYMLVVGDREAQAGQVAVRNRKQGDQGAVGVDEFLSRLSRLVTTRSLEE